MGNRQSRGNRYSGQLRSLAYQYWAFKAGRRASVVARMVFEEFPDPDDPIWEGTKPEFESFKRIINYWAKEGKWSDRVNQDFRQIAPDIREKTIQSLVVGAEEAAVFLRTVLDIYDPNHTYLKQKVEAARLLLTHGGFSTIGSQNPVEMRSGPQPHLEEILSPSEIKALQAQLGNGEGQAVSPTMADGVYDVDEAFFGEGWEDHVAPEQ